MCLFPLPRLNTELRSSITPDFSATLLTRDAFSFLSGVVSVSKNPFLFFFVIPGVIGTPGISGSPNGCAFLLLLCVGILPGPIYLFIIPKKYSCLKGGTEANKTPPAPGCFSVIGRLFPGRNVLRAVECTRKSPCRSPWGDVCG